MGIEITIAVAVGVVAGLNQAIKKAVGEKIKPYLPMIAIALGSVLSFGYKYSQEFTENLLIGIVIGLTAVGLYENVDKLKEIVK